MLSAGSSSRTLREERLEPAGGSRKMNGKADSNEATMRRGRHTGREALRTPSGRRCTEEEDLEEEETKRAM